MEVIQWSELSLPEQALCLPEVREIFFVSSSRQQFSSDQEREAFWQKWTQFYFHHHPEFLFLARRNHQVMGYLTGCPNSDEAATKLVSLHPSYSLFADQFANYPAHLHLNFLPQARGQGGGHLLVNTFVENLRKLKVPGVHIVTSPLAQNVSFYQKERFLFHLERKWHLTPLLFMGRTLSRKEVSSGEMHPLG